MEQKKQSKQAIGWKQAKKAIIAGNAKKVYIGHDADPMMLEDIRKLAEEHQVPVDDFYTMEQLGQAVGIAVNATAIAIL